MISINRGIVNSWDALDAAEDLPTFDAWVVGRTEAHRRKYDKHDPSRCFRRIEKNGSHQPPVSVYNTSGADAQTSKAAAMKNDTITLIISAALLAAALFVLFVGHLRRRNHLKRRLVMDLLKSYFKGDVPAGQFGRRTRAIVGEHFTYSDEFYALVVSAFQAAVDTDVPQQPHAEQAGRKLLSAMAALKHEFGLTDRYQVEAWRPGRE